MLEGRDGVGWEWDDLGINYQETLHIPSDFQVLKYSLKCLLHNSLVTVCIVKLFTYEKTRNQIKSAENNQCVHLTSTWCTCAFHVVYMWHPCGVHMWHSHGLHLPFTWCTHDVTSMWCYTFIDWVLKWHIIVFPPTSPCSNIWLRR